MSPHFGQARELFFLSPLWFLLGEFSFGYSGVTPGREYSRWAENVLCGDDTNGGGYALFLGEEQAKRESRGTSGGEGCEGVSWSWERQRELKLRSRDFLVGFLKGRRA